MCFANLPRRLRYYSSMSDTDMLDKGVLYSKLKGSLTIAVCLFEFYKEGLHRYTFTNRCHEIDGLEMVDGTTKIVLNEVGTADDVQGRLEVNSKCFLQKGLAKNIYGVSSIRICSFTKISQYLTPMCDIGDVMEISE